MLVHFQSPKWYILLSFWNAVIESCSFSTIKYSCVCTYCLFSGSAVLSLTEIEQLTASFSKRGSMYKHRKSFWNKVINGMALIFMNIRRLLTNLYFYHYVHFLISDIKRLLVSFVMYDVHAAKNVWIWDIKIKEHSEQMLIKFKRPGT